LTESISASIVNVTNYTYDIVITASG
jgi:hypothetical protein